MTKLRRTAMHLSFYVVEALKRQKGRFKCTSFLNDGKVQNENRKYE